MDGSVLSGAGRVICGGLLLELKRVLVRSDALGGEFAERVALGVQEERLSNICLGSCTMLQEQRRIGGCGYSFY